MSIDSFKKLSEVQQLELPGDGTVWPRTPRMTTVTFWNHAMQCIPDRKGLWLGRDDFPIGTIPRWTITARAKLQ